MERATILSFLVCVSSTSLAATWVVDGNGTGDFTTIQSAIDASSSGDFVSVQNGVYFESINFHGKAITVEGVDRENTIIDGSFTTSAVVTFDTGETNFSVLSKITIRGGSGNTWDDPIFGPQLCGGGIFCNQSSPMIQLCTISDNSAWGGGGLFATQGDPLIFFSDFTHNEAKGHGGGMYLIDQVNGSIDSCEMQHNVASWGGGMTCSMQSDPQILNSTFSANTTNNVGGGMYIRSRSSPVVLSCVFENNVQISNPLGSGGGACVYGGGETGGESYPTFKYCDFKGNVVNGDGGGLSAAYRSHPKLIDCSFSGNHAGRSGGGLACVADSEHVYPSNADVDGCVFENNSASEEGGGIHVRNSDPTFNNVRVENNSANLAGGGINFFESPLSSLENSVLCNNSPTSINGSYFDGGGNTISDACSVCEGDANGDGFVNVVDLLGAVGNWGLCDGCDFDIDGNGVVDVTDVLLIVSNWGSCE